MKELTMHASQNLRPDFRIRVRRSRHRSTTAFAAMATVLLAGAPQADAQDYPTRRIRVIAPVAPGTSTDVIARVVAQKMAERWGQPVIVDNRIGAGSVVGTTLGAKATPDGYTLTMAASSAFSTQPWLRGGVPYDPIKDFEAITNLAMTPQTLVVNPNTEWRSVKELVAAARERPGVINIATLASGSTSHLTMEHFRSVAGIRFNHVPFKGSSEASAQIMGGTVPVQFDAIPAVLPHIKSGRLRGIAIGSLKRSPFLPELPTIAESGYPGFDGVGWIGIVAPARTPVALLDRLNTQMRAILALPDVKEHLANLAFATVGDTRAEFAEYIKAEYVKWGKVVKASGAKAD